MTEFDVDVLLSFVFCLSLKFMKFAFFVFVPVRQYPEFGDSESLLYYLELDILELEKGTMRIERGI